MAEQTELGKNENFSGLQGYLIPLSIEVMENKDQDTLLHSSRVQKLLDRMIPFLQKKKIITVHEIPYLWVAAILHDIGKIFIDDKILESDKILEQSDFLVIRNHSARGCNLLKELDLPEEIILAVRHHHERWDGRKDCRFPGYPDGLSGCDIPLYARIISVADAYDAMVSERPYKKPYPSAKARKILKEGADYQFDPEIVEIFLTMIRE